MGGHLRPLLALLPLLGGCTLVQLNADADAFYAPTVLVGRVEAPPGLAGPVRVAAYRAGGPAAAPVHEVLLHEAGGYELIVPKGEYRLLAYADRNGNGAYDAGEPNATRGSPDPVVASGTGVVANLDMVLAPSQAASGPGGQARQAWPAGSRPPRHSTQAGALADLDAPAFSAESGRLGFWAPMQAFREFGGNVYFLEPYDPQRTPVLFVHGALGSAQDWRHFAEKLDRRRYQAWFFQYPSGAAVGSMGYLLYWKLLNLQLRYRFEQLVVTAHSMGGLVARSFLLDHGAQFPQLRLFVSVSTPWGGEPTADLGVRHSPAVVPSWRDMQPEGAFMKSLFARRLPPQVQHVLFFGHRGGYSLLRPNTDGTVTLASQLRADAQAEAQRVYGFDEDHTGILSSAQVFGQYQVVLDTLASGSGAAGAAASGRVQLAITFDEAREAQLLGPASLVLQPLDSGAAERRPPLVLPFDAATASAEGGGGGALPPLGPIVPGEYDVSLVLAGQASTPATQRVRIAPGAAPTLQFTLRPQGAFFGYVGADAGAHDAPAGAFRPAHETIRIRSIVLAGAGIRRVLQPRPAGTEEWLQRYARGEDDAVGAAFSFVGLPEGEYHLVIEAEGYQTHRSRHVVVPGRAPPFTPIALQPLPQ